MGHYNMVKKERKITPRRTDDVYALITGMMDSPMTAQEIAARIDLCNGSIFAVLNRLRNVGAVSRAKVGKSYVYTCLMRHVTKEDMYKLKPVVFKKAPTIEGARLIDFNSEDLRAKLHALDKQYAADKKKRSGKVYVSGQTLDMLG